MRILALFVLLSLKPVFAGDQTLQKHTLNHAIENGLGATVVDEKLLQKVLSLPYLSKEFDESAAKKMFVLIDNKIYSQFEATHNKKLKSKPYCYALTMHPFELQNLENFLVTVYVDILGENGGILFVLNLQNSRQTFGLSCVLPKEYSHEPPTVEDLIGYFRNVVSFEINEDQAL